MPGQIKKKDVHKFICNEKIGYFFFFGKKCIPDHSYNNSLQHCKLTFPRKFHKLFHSCKLQLTVFFVHSNRGDV